MKRLKRWFVYQLFEISREEIKILSSPQNWNFLTNILTQKFKICQTSINNAQNTQKNIIMKAEVVPQRSPKRNFLKS